VGDLHGWQADPHGLHEARYFSQGQPTRLVQDGGRESYDEVPTSRATMNGSAPDLGSFGGVPPASPSTNAIPPITPSPAAGLNPPPAVGQFQGWAADPYRRHVHRYFIEGRPTVHVSDGGPVFEDVPTATASISAPGVPSQPAHTAVGIWSLNDEQPEGWVGEPYPRQEEAHFEEAAPTQPIRNGGRDDQAGARPLAEPSVTSETLPETRGLHSVRSRGPEPGWYAGVSGTPGLHFWDGTQWTEHTWQDPLAQSTTMQAQETPTSPADLGPGAPGTRACNRWWNSRAGEATTLVVTSTGITPKDSPPPMSVTPGTCHRTTRFGVPLHRSALRKTLIRPHPCRGDPYFKAGRPTPTGVMSSGISATASRQVMSVMRGFNRTTHHRSRRVGRPTRMIAMNFATSSTAGRRGWSATVGGRSTTVAVLDETGAAPDGRPMRHP
jgi:hypothetical protein